MKIKNISDLAIESVRSFAEAFNRLTGERHYDVLDVLTFSADYTYDLAGNRTQTVVNGVTNTYALGLGNRLDTWTGCSYSHNDAGCVTSITDAAGTRQLEWNSQYRLTAVSTDGALAEAFGYDPLGRRAWTSDGSVTNWHVHDGMHVIADLDETGAVLRSYTWGPGIDNLLAITVHDAVTNTYYAITDRLGTVHALADETGAIVESYRFDAWGNVLDVFDSNGQTIPESAIGNRFLFQGREYSWSTGLYKFRARWYDPVTGRWLSNDPIGISGGLNQYVAFGNNPVNNIDPWGLCETPSDGSKGTGSFAMHIGGVVGSGVAGTIQTVQDGSLGIWVGKNWEIYSTSWGGNQHTGGRFKFAGRIANRARYFGTTVSVITTGAGLYETIHSFRIGDSAGALQAGVYTAAGAIGFLVVCLRFR